VCADSASSALCTEALLEDLEADFFRHDGVVVNGEDHFVPEVPAGDGDPAADLGGFESVLYHVAEDASEQSGVSGDRGLTDFTQEDHTALRNVVALIELCKFLKEGSRLHRTQAKPEVAGFGVYEVTMAFDLFEEMPGGLFEDADFVGVFGVRVDFRSQHAGESCDTADNVNNIVEKRALEDLSSDVIAHILDEHGCEVVPGNGYGGCVNVEIKGMAGLKPDVAVATGLGATLLRLHDGANGAAKPAVLPRAAAVRAFGSVLAFHQFTGAYTGDLVQGHPEHQAEYGIGGDHLSLVGEQDKRRGAGFRNEFKY